MKKLSVIFALTLYLSSFSWSEELEPNLVDPKVLDRIISEGQELDKLDFRKKANGEEMLYLRRKQSPYSGWSFKFHKNGQVAKLIKTVEGRVEFYTAWYEEGGKYNIERYKDGKPAGIWTEWHEDGQKKTEGMFVDGKKDGLWKEWYSSGIKKLEIKYRLGEIVEQEINKEEAARNWINTQGIAYISSFFALTGSFPKNLNELKAPPDEIPAFIKNDSDLNDPWGKPYKYADPGIKNKDRFDLWTTDEKGLEIGNWDSIKLRTLENLHPPLPLKRLPLTGNVR